MSDQSSDAPQWCVTWRHSHESPLQVRVTSAASREHAQQLQREKLAAHAKECYACWRARGADTREAMTGDRDRIVTRIRTRDAVLRTAYRLYGFGDSSLP